jgi:hypothetical protein
MADLHGGATKPRRLAGRKSGKDTGSSLDDDVQRTVTDRGQHQGDDVPGGRS